MMRPSRHSPQSLERTVRPLYEPEADHTLRRVAIASIAANNVCRTGSYSRIWSNAA